MPFKNSMAVFCEDVRQEANGQVSIIGIYPDNIDLEFPESEEIPRLPRLAVYVRTSFDVDAVAEGLLTVSMVAPDGDIVFANSINLEDHREQVSLARDAGAPIFTLVTHMLMPVFPVLQWGRFDVWTEHDDQKSLAGFLRITNSARTKE